MSLSRFFKNSHSFQPENLVGDGSRANSGWQDITHTTPTAQPFSPEQQIKEQIKTAREQETPEKLTAKPQVEQEDHPLPTPTDPVDKQTEQLPPSIDQENIPQEPQIPAGYLSEEEVIKREKAAFDSGKLEGIKEGEEQAAIKLENDYNSATKALLSVCTQLETCRDTIINNSSKELQDFAVAIAEKIIRFSVRHHDQTIIATIEEALQRSIKSSEFYIYINPEDYESVAAKSDELIGGVNGLDNLILKTDPNVERGGARIESDNCTIDATIASQFELIREEVQKQIV